MLATQYSMVNSLRWLRRLIVLILIVANFIAVSLADAGHTLRVSPSLSAIPSLFQQP